ncbi:MAG: EFR1 family ferrodoxin [Spirochaetaceae bacterium]
MRTELYYFTGTGNSLYLTKQIANKFENSKIIPITNLDLTKDVISYAENIGIIFPVYCLDIPEIVKQFMKVLKTNNNSYIFIYYSYGGSSGNTAFKSFKILKDNNIILSNYFGVKLPDNSIVYTPPKENIKIIFDSAYKIIISSIDKICAKEISKAPPYNYLNNISGALLKIGVWYLGFDRMYIIPDKCTNCNLCTRICPLNNIEENESLPIIKKNCEMCFACINFCPKEAIRYHRMKDDNNFQYKNPHVTFSEIENMKVY